MMVPRSYPYLQHSPPSPRNSPKSDRMGTRTARNPLAVHTIKSTEKTLTVHTRSIPTSEPRVVQPATTMLPQSKPVVIPPRSPSRSANSTQTIRMRGQNGGRPSRTSKNHNSTAIPPAVAALLAVTAIPKMPMRRRKGSAMDKRISMDELIQEWKQDDTEASLSLSGSPLDLLLGRVDESEDEYGSLQSIEQEQESSFLTTRSISTDSLSTLPPSLDYDGPSFASHWDNLSTPDSVSRKSLSERKEKVMSSPPKEDCVLDHPLLHFSVEECEEIIATDIPDVVIPLSTSTERFKSFKSNLTASLQALKSAAKSFSNFTAPSVPPDDFLIRSLLAPNFTSEMRPKHLEGLPSPALRRYLNPQPSPISPTELSMQLHDALMIDADSDPHAPMIQMQTYERRGRSSKSRRRASDPLTETGKASPSPPSVRQREPRENSDFLRVIVLEMNMRRVGKLDSKAVGRARIWLPPRKPSLNKATPILSANGVPTRWAGVSAE